MKSLSKSSLAALLLAGVASQAYAADLPEPAPYEPPPAVEYTPAPAFGGWYIRGDLDYHWNDFRDANYYTFSQPSNPALAIKSSRHNKLRGELSDEWSIGGGVGYQINNYLRADLTADYFADADFEGSTKGFCFSSSGTVPCSSEDRTKLSTWLLLANAYVDLYTYKGFTVYGGAGIGGAHMKWDDLENTIGNDTTKHKGNSEWRFAYALMAGGSYCLTSKLDLDVGYRYSRVEGGEMFGYKENGGPGFDHGLNVHEVRAGLRYNFGDKGYRDGCGTPAPAPYEPPAPEPVYK